VTFLVAEGVAGIFDANASVDASRSPRSIAGVLNPVIASGDALAGGAVFKRSWASLTEVGTLVNLIDPEADDVVESIEPFVRGLTLSSGPGELAHGEGSGFKGDIVETASETLIGMAKGDESPRLDTDIRRSRSVGSSERRRILGELQMELSDISKGRANEMQIQFHLAYVVLTPSPNPDPGIVSPLSLAAPSPSPTLLLPSSSNPLLDNKLDDMPSRPTDPPLSLLPLPPCSYCEEIEFTLSLLALA
jgi:hypothetical protein